MKLIISIFVILLLVPFLVSALDADYLLPPQTFDSDEGNWFLAPGDEIREGYLYLSSTNNQLVPTRWVHDISVDTINTIYRCDFDMNYTAPTGNNYGFWFQHINSTDVGVYSKSVAYANIHESGEVRLYGNAGPIVWNAVAHTTFKKYSLIFNSTDNKFFGYVDDVLKGERIMATANDVKFVMFNGDNSPVITFWIDNLRCYNGTVEPLEPPDTTPPVTTFINLTSEGGLGQIIFDDNSTGFGTITHKLSEPSNLPDREAFYDGINMSGNKLLLHFDGNSTSDHSGNGNDGTAQGGANVTPEGKIGDGYMFDGNDDYVDIDSVSRLEEGTAHSLVGWVKPIDVTVGGASAYTVIASGKGISPDRVGIVIRGSELTYGIYDGNSYIITESGSISSGIWTHFGVSYNGVTANLYINGVLQTGSTSPFLGDVDAFVIGTTVSKSDKDYEGNMDEIAIFNRSLTPQEIKRIYEQGIGYRPMRTNDTTPSFRTTTDEDSTCALYMSPRLNLSNASVVYLGTFDQNATDESQYGNDGTVSGATHTSNGYIRGGFEILGTTNSITTGKEFTVDGIINQSVTVMAWTKCSNDPITDCRYIAGQIRATGHPTDMYGLRYASNSFTWRVDTADSQRDTTTGVYDLTEWHHVAGTYDGSEQCIYVDGIQIGCQVQTGSIVSNQSGGFTIGARVNGLSALSRDKIVDEVVLLKIALSAEEILDIYNNGFSPNLNYSQMVRLNPSRECSTTGGTAHTCATANSDEVTLDEVLRGDTRTGIASGFLACKDGSGNENRTSTSGMFYVNITDGEPPAVEIGKNFGLLYVIPTNNTNILFNGSSTDNVDRNYTLDVDINGSRVYSNNTYLNGTEWKFTFTRTLGVYNLSVIVNDSYDNINVTDTVIVVEQLPSVNIFVDGNNETIKYEYRSWTNITANCTNADASDCTVSIDLNAPNYGESFVSGTNEVSFIYNITNLRIINFSHGPTSVSLTSADDGLNVTSDINTEILSVRINITSADESGDVNISYGTRIKRLIGTLKTVYLETNTFIHSGADKIAVNLSYPFPGSNFIFVNLTDVDEPINLSFEVSGFDLDIDNEFSYIEHLNGTSEAKGINETLSERVDASMGILNNFENNNSRWDLKKGNVGCILDYRTFEGEQVLRLLCAVSQNDQIIDTDLAADLRNTSRVEIILTFSHNGIENPDESNFQLLATDGISDVELFFKSVAGAGLGLIPYNITLIKNSDDYTSWIVIVNSSGGTGTKDISSLEFDNRIRLKYRVSSGSPGATGIVYLKKISQSGVWLNNSNTNGTYHAEGNFTSRVLSVTETNISKATLTAAHYKPSGTNINYFLSNTCNATFPTFESVELGIQHTFETVGNEICMRTNMISTTNTTSPVIRKYQIDIVKSSVENVTVALDNIDVWSYTGTLNESTSPKVVNFTPNSGQLNTIKISSATSGLIMVDNFKVNSSVNPLVLNISEFEDCNICNINFSFSGSNLVVDDLQLDFLGSWNYTAIAKSSAIGTDEINISIYYSNFNLSHPSGYIWYDVFPSSAFSKNITPYKQSSSTPIWNLTNQAYDERIDVYAKTNETIDCLNVTFSNNTNRIRNITNETFIFLNGTAVQLDNINLVNSSGVVFNASSGVLVHPNNYTIDYADGTILLNGTNETWGDRLLFAINYSYLSYGFDLDRDYTFKLNLSYQKIIHNISVDLDNPEIASRSIWNWWNLYNCTSAMEFPWFYFSSICTDCYFNTEFLPETNLIIE